MSNAHDLSEGISATNGLNVSTGDYFFPPQSLEELAALALNEYDEVEAQRAGAEPTKEHLDKSHIDELKWSHRRAEKNYEAVAGVDSKNLNETGWGVIFAAGNDAKVMAVREALSELLDLRRRQATAEHGKAHYYREFIGDKGYRPGSSKIDFLQDNNASYGPADPENVPYYLLIVGDPDTIPYSFQYQLDIQYAVGRVYFDTLAEYAQYARSVVMAETGKVTLPRRAVLFGVHNDDDPPTHLSSTLLVTPLARELDAGQEPFIKKGMSRWEVQTCLKAEATKARLLGLMGGRQEQPPALLFTASHGAAFSYGDSRMEAHQGALVCQDWPGPRQWGRSKPVPQDFYLAGDDLGDDASASGMIAFHFACFGAGTPQKDDFSYIKSMPIAPHSFVARLPQRLLGHPKGGALAVIGHVERAWDYSFKWGKRGSQTQTFRSTMLQLMDGYPVGAAMEFINQRYAQLSSVITDYEHKVRGGLIPNKYELASMWAANNDARSYVIIGDPAVRVVASDNSSSEDERTLCRGSSE
jgi:hypothetical protein